MKLKISNTTFLVFFIIFLTCQFISFGQTSKLEYIDKKNRFKISYPATWRIKGNPQARLIIADINNQDNSSGLQIRIYKKNNLSFQKFARWYVKNFLKDMKNTKTLSAEFCYVGEYPGFIATFDAKTRNNYFLMSYLIPRGEQVFVFQSGTPFKNHSKIEPILNSIAFSFTFL